MKTLTILLAINPCVNNERVALEHLNKTAQLLEFLHPQTKLVTSITDKYQYNDWWLKERGACFNTDFVMTLEMDSAVLNPSAWSDEFFEYDYIGAPWKRYQKFDKYLSNIKTLIDKKQLADREEKEFLVGNSGFSITSKRLCDWLVANCGKRTTWCDQFICFCLRRNIEAAGFHFAPYDVAKRFSVEDDEYVNQLGAHKVIVKNENRMYIKPLVERGLY